MRSKSSESSYVLRSVRNRYALFSTIAILTVPSHETVEDPHKLSRPCVHASMREGPSFVVSGRLSKF
jgi:hypothetical protein